MTRRSHTELVYEVLATIDSGTRKPTHILFNTRINWRLYKDIMGMLKENNYVVERESYDASTRNKIKYYLSEDGKKALAGMRYLKKIFA